MGLAATQARYLGLTARKTNVEYEGQQINQQRLSLSNESAGLYQELYNLSIPTPPVVTDYYKTEYSYNAAGTKYTVNSYTPDDEGTYTVNVSYSDYVKIGEKAFATAHIIQSSDGTYSIQIAGNTNAYTLDPAAAQPNPALDKARGLSSPSTYCSYTDSDNGRIYYLGTDWLSAQEYPFINTAERYITNSEVQTINENRNGCKLSFDASGMIYSIVDPKISETSLEMKSESIEDSQSYESAMNKYNTEYAQYQKEMEVINSKTAEIQQEDRSLELRLKQLDTEQQSLQTELEALKSVLDKNLEKVFKVFNS